MSTASPTVKHQSGVQNASVEATQTAVPAIVEVDARGRVSLGKLGLSHTRPGNNAGHDRALRQLCTTRGAIETRHVLSGGAFVDVPMSEPF